MAAYTTLPEECRVKTKKTDRNLRQQFNAPGVYVFVATPFKWTRDRRGKFDPDLQGMERNIDHLASIKGDKAMVICGGSGEFHSLSPAEVIALAEAAVAGAGGRCNVIVGVGGTTANAARMAAAAQVAGCNAVLVMPHPPEVRKGEKVLWERHRAVSRATDIGVMPFRAPSQLLSAELVQRLEKIDNVVAIKEESGAIDWVRTGIRLTDGRLPIVTGGSENMVPYYYLAGAIGFTTGMANISLPQSIKLHTAALRRDFKRAMEWRDYFDPLSDMRGAMGNAMIKAGLEMMGLAGGPMRDTGETLDAAGRRKVRALMRAKGLL